MAKKLILNTYMINPKMDEKSWFSNQESRKYALEVLGETDQKRTELLAELRSWITTVPGLHARTDDMSLLAFLRGCKFNIDKTKEKILNFYAMKAKRIEWFRDRNPSLETMRELLELGVFVPLRRFHEGRLVCMVRAGGHDPRKYIQDDVFKIAKMLLDVAVREFFESSTVYGVTCVIDMTGVTARHAQQLPPKIIKKAVYAWQNYTCRPKAIEFVNAPLYINVVLNIFKSFMSEKLKKRVRVHFGGVESLYAFVDKSILPTNYGGTGESMEELVEFWRRKLDENKEWFKDDEQYKYVDPSK